MEGLFGKWQLRAGTSYCLCITCLIKTEILGSQREWIRLGYMDPWELREAAHAAIISLYEQTRRLKKKL